MRLNRIPRRWTAYAASLAALTTVVSLLYVQADYRYAPAATVPQAVVVVKSLSHDQFEQAVQASLEGLKSGDIRRSFEYVKRRAAADPSFAKDCHPLLHRLGHESFMFQGSFAKAMERQDELCNSGYTHGVIESYFSGVTDVRQAVLSTCPPSSDLDFRQWQCFHGIGHGVMLATEKDVARSLELCRTLGGEPATACANGVFMERFIVVGHDGHRRTTAPADLDDCRQQTVAYKPDCYYYAPTAYIALHETDYAGAFGWCGKAEPGYAAGCMRGAAGQAMKDNITDPASVRRFCDSLEKRYRAVCAEGAVSIYANHHASSSAAARLCDDAFKGYDSVCTAVAARKKSDFSI